MSPLATFLWVLLVVLLWIGIVAGIWTALTTREEYAPEVSQATTKE